ncbi:ATP-binding protein [Streptomyces pseudovenezuelae]|uniref:ATP-binding protein n=1 Tax=Streptomyces pseudovenezuelae TaxID=67350 RepID=UPI0036F0029A
MSDRGTPTRPVKHRRVADQRTPVERFTLAEIRWAVAVPLLVVVVLLGATVVVWQTALASSGQVLAGLVCGIGVCLVVGEQRVRAASGRLQQQREAEAQARAAKIQKIKNAVAAVEKSVLWSTDEWCRGKRPAIPDTLPPVEGSDDEADIVQALEELKIQALASLTRVHDESRSTVLLEVLRGLSQRQRSQVNKALAKLEELENLTDDPDILAALFEVDHLVTLLRRNAESMAVMGDDSQRRERAPLSLRELVRGAISEVLDYQRVTPAKAAVDTALALPGHVGPDVMHALAELIENACTFSAPETQVYVQTERVPAGLAIEVLDKALPISPRQRTQLNHLLKAPDEVDVIDQLRSGKYGLFVTAKIAHKHGLSVQLFENATGGTRALLVVPARHLTAPAPAGSETPPPAAAPVLTPPPGQPAQERPRPVQRRPAVPPGPGSRLPSRAPRLPQRVKGQDLIPAEDRPQRAIPGTANPRAAAAFRSGVRSGQAQAAPRSAAPPVPPAQGAQPPTGQS